MKNPNNPFANASTYFINPNDASELGRLLAQDHSVTNEMGDLFPRSIDTTRVRSIIDLACGPGGYLLNVAQTYPQIECIGIDLSEKMISYAQAQIDALHIQNVSFQCANILSPLEFPDTTFDFVNARLVSSFVPVQYWPQLLQEVKRITIPGGIIRFTEAEWIYTNSRAGEALADIVIRAHFLSGKSFAPDGKRFGTTLELPYLLRDVGLQNIHRTPFSLDFSSGSMAHEVWYHNLMIAYPLMLPYLLKMEVVTQNDFHQLYEQLSLDMMEETFRGEFFLLSASGMKP